MLYVALLGYLCAPDVIIFLPKRLTDDVRNFLHSIIFFVVLVVSMFILLFIQTIETKQYLIHTTADTGDVGGSSVPLLNNNNASMLPTPSPLQKAMTFPVAVKSSAPPPPEIPILPTTNWTWPTVTIVPSTSPLPPRQDANFPSYLPPIIPKTWDVPTAASPSGSDNTDGGGGGGSGGLAESPSPERCVTVTTQETRDCIPLPPLAQPLPPSRKNKSAPSPSPQQEDTSWIRVVVQAVNQYNKMSPNAAHYSTPDWVQFFRKFSRQDNVSSLLEKSSKDSNKLIQVMTRLTQFKDAKDSAGAENYVNQQAI